MVLVLWDDRPARAAGVDAPRVLALPMLHELSEVFLLAVARRFVAIGEHAERRMIAVGLQDAVRLGVDPLVNGCAIPDRRSAVGPGGALDVVHHTHLIGREERCFRRTPRMKTQMVEAMGLGGSEDLAPCSYVRRRIAGQREDAAFECAAKEGLAPVESELRPLRGEFPHAEDDCPFVCEILPLDRHPQAIQVRRELVPQPHVVAHRIIDLHDLIRVLHRKQHGPLGHFVPSARIEARCLKRQRPRVPLAAVAGDRDANLGVPVLDVRIDLHVGNLNVVIRSQFDVADDAVPVGLRVVGDAVRVDTDADLDRVVHADRQGVPALAEHAEIIFVGHAEAVVRADRLAVDPDLSLPVTSFEEQHDPFGVPLAGDVDFLLVPGGSNIVFDWSQPEGHFDVARLAVRLILFGCEPGLVHDLAGPRRLDGHFVAVAVLPH